MSMHGISDDTPIMPWIVADTVIEEVDRCYPGHLDSDFRLADKLAQRAERHYKTNAHFRKTMRSRGNKGRDTLYSFMRHWLTAEVRKSDPVLFRKLPQSFWTGTPLRCDEKRRR